MIRKNYVLAVTVSLGFFSACYAEENISTFFDQLEEQVKDLETKTNPPKKEIAPTQLVNTEAPEETASLKNQENPESVEVPVTQDEKTTDIASQETTAPTETTTVKSEIPVTQEEPKEVEITESKMTEEPLDTDSLEDDEDEIDLESNEIE